MIDLMKSKGDAYREQLRMLDAWDDFLLRESGLPGRRANIELAHAVAQEGDETLFRRFLTFDAGKAPTNSPYEFLAFCGVLGLGQLLLQERHEVLPILRNHASDPRWRIREAVAMALQCWGRRVMEPLLREMEGWSHGNVLERRAAVASVCEPGLLKKEGDVERVLKLLETVTLSIQRIDDRQSDEFKALRKGLSYCWSIAVAAFPIVGKQFMERWFGSDDPDIVWIMKENLKKRRLERMDRQWVISSRSQLTR